MLVLVAVGSLASIPLGTGAGDRNEKEQEDNAGDDSKIQQGFAIAPVPLDLRGKNRALVGLGSYIVNTGGCNDCHTTPSYAPGHDPYLGQPAQVKFNLKLSPKRPSRQGHRLPRWLPSVFAPA
jgi:hypothetical protein